MLKKIILGIVITAILSVTAFGAVYAYQKESARIDGSVNENKLFPSYSSGQGKNYTGYGNTDCEDCLKAEERVRNNLRNRENEDDESYCRDRQEIRWQHRYEYEKHFSEEAVQECGENKQYKNQNGSNRNGGGRR